MNHSVHAIFNWEFMSSLSLATTVVLAIANTLGMLWRWNRLLSALIAAEILTFYAAFRGSGSLNFGEIVEALAYGAVLFCYTVGAHQTLLAIRQRVMGGAQLAAANGNEWWGTWFV